MTEPQHEMPRYQCHKKVWALKIETVERHGENDPNVDTAESGFFVAADLGYGKIELDAEYMRKHNPQAGGYYVVYEDGYKSYSPAEAFESGYTRIS